MRIWCCAAVMVSLCTGITFAQNDPKPDDLKKMYDDTLARLKDAQDRKNQLATENDKLAARVAELEKQVKADQTQIDDMRRDSATSSERWFILRAQMSAWESFLNHDPELRARWIVFFENGFIAPPPALPMLGDPMAMIAAAPIDVSLAAGPTTQPEATTQAAQGAQGTQAAQPLVNPAIGAAASPSVGARAPVTLPTTGPASQLSQSTSSAGSATQPSH